ncbi:uncharacterized protein LOC132755831 [Ruditapes philippinarum]|uniref:uncharacterized protein LOC132755831 n=1 Tax=Ruditapes philippinarum TaxID=129788 RepID=UPI00295B3AC1|nr:uncharacterized protein LOC132755831 [Ruditapes philippinarum]
MMDFLYIEVDSPSVVPELRFIETPLTKGPFKILYQPYIQFRCVFSNSSKYFYSVHWIIDGREIATLGPSQDIDELTLREENFRDIPLGYTVQCSVTVSAAKLGQQTQTQYSDNFYAGVKVYNSTVFLKKGSHTQISVSSTLPIGCSHFDNVHKFCKDELRISDAADISCLQETVTNIVETDSTKCTEYIKTLYKGATWDPDKLYHFKIVTSDIDYEDKSTFNLNLKFSGDMKHTFWKNKILPDVRVVVIENEDYKDKVCYSHIDPHMRTADGYHYEQQQEGNFILYYNQQYNIEVQETTKSCWGRATCACGVSVRAGKDVFIINRCGKTNFLGFSQCDDGGILQVVRNTDREYTVYTPIGTKVTIFLWMYGYMNIDIKMAPKDKYNVRGLCGNFDGDATNDLVHSNQKISALKTETVFYRRHHEEFANSWRVPGENLYSRKKRALESWANLNGLFCVCQKGKQEISSEALCSSTQYLDCEMQKSITKTKCNIYSVRKKRSPAAHEKEMDRLFALMQPVENHDVRKRQTNGNVISEVQAKERCTNKIKGSLAFTSYTNMTASEDPNAVISQCIFDIMATNDESFADVHVDSVNTIVKGMMDEVPTYVETNKKEVQVFLKNSCSRDCSDRGNCSDDGECICHQYYHGAICDIDERIPPIVTDIEGGCICDTGEGEDCRCFYVRGDNFLESLKCKIVTSEISISGEKINVTVETLAGGFEDIFTGVCCIPEENVFSRDMFVREHDVSVSSDGVHYGENNTMYIFDSSCQKLDSLATGRPSFNLKNGFCFIEHACIKDTYAFLSNNDTCLSCNTSVSVTDWTETSLEICIPTTTTTSTKTTTSYTSTTATPTTTEDVENQTDPGITPTTHSMLTTSGMGSSKKRCKAKELLRLKQRKETLSFRNKKRKKKLQRLTEQIKRLKQLVKRVRNDRKKGNNQTTTQQP